MKANAFVMIPHSNKKATEIEWMVAPLVICNDCKWWNVEWKHNEDGQCFCYKMHQWTVPQFFCAVGERRDTDGEDD